YHAGDPAGALAAWKISQSQGIIQKTAYYSEMRQWVAKAEAAVSKTGGSISEAKKSCEGALNAALASQMEAMSAGADRQSGFAAGQRRLQEAWQQFNQASDAGGFDKARRTADDARTLFLQAKEEEKSRKVIARVPAGDSSQSSSPSSQPPPRQETSAARVPAVQGELDFVVEFEDPKPKAQKAETSPPLPPARTPVAERPSTPLPSASGPKQSPAAPAATEAKRLPAAQPPAVEPKRLPATLPLDSGAKPGEPATQPLPSTMIDVSAGRGDLGIAFRAFAHGDLDRTEAITSHLVAAPGLAAEAHLLRACAIFTRSRLENRDELLDLAGSDFRAALRLNPRLTLDRRYFSPKLIAFFEELRKSGTQ
ncbi:MAG TPA: hypothetical protein VM534_01940, partial [Thermoanaerobaculia bacterium]|nr:hypothetical protein [Thermoanaerobaculia bacterium]